MAEEGQARGGIFASIRRLADTFLSAVHNRVELFALELQEEKHWLIATLLWSAAAIFFGVLAILLVVALIFYVVPATGRLFVLIGFCVGFIGLAVWALAGLRRQFNQKRPLSDTLGELEKDIAWLREKK